MKLINQKITLKICISISLFSLLTINAFNLSTTNLPKQNSSMISHFGHLKLISSSAQNSSSTDFYFNSNASSGFDPGYDASLYGGIIPEFSLYSHLAQNSSGTPFAIQTLGSNDMNDIIIPLGLHALQGQDINISIFESDLPEHISVYLDDFENNSTTLLNTDDYLLHTDEDISGIGRFFIRFESNALHLVASSLDSLDILINNKDKTLIVNGQILSKTIVNLYDLNGKLLNAFVIKHESISNTFDISTLNSGLFIVELTNTINERMLKKLIKN